MTLNTMFYIVWSIICIGVGYIIRWIIEQQKDEVTVEQALEVLRQNGWQEVKDKE